MNRENNYNNSDWTRLSVIFLIIAGILMLFSFIVPILFTRGIMPWDFTETGQIGDTIGGLMNPFIAIGGVIMTFLAFYMQLRANQIQREQFVKSINRNNVNEKIDCYYKLQLIKLDIDKTLNDIDKRIEIIKQFVKSQKENLYHPKKMKHSPMKHYDRFVNSERLSIYKGFKYFMSLDEDWVDKFNNLYNAIDYTPEGLREIYITIENHNKEVFNDKLAIRNDLTELEKRGVRFADLYFTSKKHSESNEIVREMLTKHREELIRSNNPRVETDFGKLKDILEKFNGDVSFHFKNNEYITELAHISDLVSQILLRLNFIKQKSEHLSEELDAFVRNMNSITAGLRDISAFISTSLTRTSLEQLQKEYNTFPEE